MHKRAVQPTEVRLTRAANPHVSGYKIKSECNQKNISYRSTKNRHDVPCISHPPALHLQPLLMDTFPWTQVSSPRCLTLHNKFRELGKNPDRCPLVSSTKRHFIQNRTCTFKRNEVLKRINQTQKSGKKVDKISTSSFHKWARMFRLYFKAAVSMLNQVKRFWRNCFRWIKIWLGPEVRGFPQSTNCGPCTFLLITKRSWKATHIIFCRHSVAERKHLSLIRERL